MSFLRVPLNASSDCAWSLSLINKTSSRFDRWIHDQDDNVWRREACSHWCKVRKQRKIIENSNKPNAINGIKKWWQWHKMEVFYNQLSIMQYFKVWKSKSIPSTTVSRQQALQWIVKTEWKTTLRRLKWEEIETQLMLATEKHRLSYVLTENKIFVDRFQRSLIRISLCMSWWYFKN